MQKIQKILSALGHRVGFAVFAAFLASIFTFAMPQQAEARGQIEFDGAFGYAGMFGKYTNDHNGFTFTLAGRYRALDWLAIGVEQDLGGLFEDDNEDWHGFYGATIFGAKLFYTHGNAELFGNLGIGAVYINMSWHGPGAKSEWDNAWFGMRLGVGGTYYIQSNVGIGLNFDYTPSFDDDVTTHFLKLQLHLVFLL